MFKVTGLWLNKDSKGNSYMSGNIGGIRVIIFKNDYKEEGDNQPEYEMFFAEQKKKETLKEKSDFDDDIPF